MSTAVFPVRVYYEDTDVSGVVYHANYLRWFERARTEWLRALGFSQEQLIKQLGVAFTVASLEIDYRLPARLDEQLEVHTDVPLIRRASMSFEQSLRRADDPRVMAQARVRVGCVDSREFRPIAVPGAVLQAIEREKQAKNI